MSRRYEWCWIPVPPEILETAMTLWRQLPERKKLTTIAEHMDINRVRLWDALCEAYPDEMRSVIERDHHRSMMRTRCMRQAKMEAKQLMQDLNSRP